MLRSVDRILTTHTGSLPRPPDLAEMLLARDQGQPVEANAFRDRVRAAVIDVVARQANAGVNVVNDGEMGKIGYSTYVKDRLTGFGGTSGSLQPADMLDYPAYAQRYWGGRAGRSTPACTGPISVRDQAAVQSDIDNLRAAVERTPPVEAFMTAASPGVISLFLRNEYYPTHEAYLGALADAMKVEYEAIAGAGFVLQVDCPDLAMGRHIQFADLDLRAFRRNAALHVEALNHALAGIPPEQLRLHLCWGNYEGPHHRDVALRDIMDIVLTARPSAISLEACNPRHEHEWAVFEDVRLADGKLLIPGVVDSTNNYIEHPDLVAQRIVRYAELVGRENVLAGTDCGFGTFVGSSQVDPDIAWAKLGALAEGAKSASRTLWA